MNLRDKVWFFSTLQHYIEKIAASSNSVIEIRNAKANSLEGLYFTGQTDNQQDTYLTSVTAYGDMIYQTKSYLDSVTATGRTEYVPQNYLDSVIASGAVEYVPQTYFDTVTVTGKCEQTTLPEGYLELEYLTFSANCWFETPFILNQDSEVQAKFKPTIYNTWMYGTNPANPRVTLFIYTVNNGANERWGNASVIVNEAQMRMGQIHETLQNKQGVVVDGTLYPYSSVASFQTPNSLCIGWSRQTTSESTFVGDFYYLRILQNGVLVADYIPVINPQGHLGFYNKVDGSFLENEDSGTLTAGPIVYRSHGVKTPYGSLKVEHASGLPLGYKKVDYITFDGTQYLETQLYPNQNTEFIVDYQSNIDSLKWIFGARTYDPSDLSVLPWNKFTAQGISSNSQSIWMQYDDTATLEQGFYPANLNTQAKRLARHSIGYKGADVYFDDVKVGTIADTTNFQSQVPVLIGQAHGKTGITTNGLNGKVFGATNMLPCVRESDNEPGLYDVSLGLFYPGNTTLGYGSFVTDDVVISYKDGANTEIIRAHDKNLFNPYTVTSGYQLDSNGVPVSSNEFGYSDKIFVEPGQTISLSLTTTKTTTTNREVRMYDCEDNYVSSVIPAPVTMGPGTYSTPANLTAFTIPAGVSYFRINVLVNDVDTNIQLETGSSSTTYESYKNYGEATLENLLGVGSVTDSQEVISGSVIRNVGIKYFDGTESWVADSTNLVYSLAKTNFVSAPASGTTLISSHFNSGAWTTQGNASFGTNNFNINWDNLGNNLSGFTSWLAQQYAAGDPVFIIYPYATAQSESVAGQSLSKGILTLGLSSVSGQTVSSTTASVSTPSKTKPVGLKCNNGVMTFAGDSTYTTSGTQEILSDAQSNTATVENLLAISTLTDTHEILSGLVSRNIGVKVLTGSENWTGVSGESNVFICQNLLSQNDKDSSIACLSTHYTGRTPATTTSQMNDGEIKAGFNNTQNDNTVYIKDVRFSTVDSFKEFLATQYRNGTPIVVLHPLMTTQTSQVLAQSLIEPPITVSQASISDLDVDTTYTLHSIPEPQYPLSLKINNGVVSPVCLDKSTFTSQDAWINETGLWRLSSDSGSVIIPVTVGHNYTLSINITMNIFRYGQSSSATTTSSPGVQLTNWWRGSASGYNTVNFTATKPYFVIQTNKSRREEFKQNVVVVDNTATVSGTQETLADNSLHTATVENLFTLKDVDSVTDSQEVISGALTKRVGMLVLNGAETWASSNVTATHMTVGMTVPLMDTNSSGSPLLSNSFDETAVNITTAGTTVGLKATSGILYARLDLATWPTLSDWQSWLNQRYSSGNPVVVLFKLKTATQGSVTPQVLTTLPIDVVQASLTGLTTSHTETEHLTPSSTFPLNLICNNGVIEYDGDGGYTVTGTQTIITDNVGNTATVENLFSVGSTSTYKDRHLVLTGTIYHNTALYIFNGTEIWDDTNIASGYLRYAIQPSTSEAAVDNAYVLTTHYPTSTTTSASTEHCCFNNKYLKVYPQAGITTAAQMQAFCASQYSAGTPLMVIYKKSSQTATTVPNQTLTKAPVTLTQGSIPITVDYVSSSASNPKPTAPLNLLCPNGVVSYDSNLGEIVVTGNKETVTIEGVNLLDPSAFTDGYYLDGDGTPVPNADYCYSGDVSTGRYNEFVVSGVGTSVRVVGYDSFYDVWHEITTFQQINNKSFAHSFTLDGFSNITKLRVTTKISTAQLQLEVGTQGSKYTPYRIPQVATNNVNLFKVNDIRDIYNAKTGLVLRAIKLKVLTGAETITALGISDAVMIEGFAPDSDTTHFAKATPVESNYFGGISWIWQEVTNNTAALCDGTLADSAIWKPGHDLVMRSSSIEHTAEAWQTWLADRYNSGNPVIIAYGVSTENIITETGPIEDVNIEEGRNLFTGHTDYMPSSVFYVEYKGLE